MSGARRTHGPARRTNGPALLRLCGVGREFRSQGGGITALRDINLTIRPGEFVAIMGPSGSGKSTLMNILGCLDRPTSGSYQIDGQDTALLNPDELAQLRRATFGFVFQRYHLIAGLDALENAAIPAIYAGSPEVIRTRRSAELLEQLGMGSRLHHRPNELSGGQQQRVSIARALINGATIILADEPTGALDSQSGNEVLRALKDLNDGGRTVVLITHDEQIARHARRIVRLHDGCVVSDHALSATDALDPKSAQYGPARAAVGQLLRGDDQGRSAVAVFIEALRMAWRSLLHNRLRTALTMLGVVIGVASVLAMLAIGSGAKRDVLERIQAMGTDLLDIKRGLAAVRGSSKGVITLTPEDLSLLTSLPGVVAAVPETEATVVLRYGNQDLEVPAIGTSDEFRTFATGRFRRVCFFPRTISSGTV